jgi:D-alanyl-D-alanine carboxypeptidase
MSRSPFLTTTDSRRRRQSAALRRRRRARLLGALVLIAVLAVAVTLISRSGGQARGRAGAAAGAAHPGSERAGQGSRALSQTGLPLGKPPVTLTGLGQAGDDPVKLAFHQPPRAGILFNLSTGQVLWQRNPELHLPIASLTKMMTALIAVRSAPADALVQVTRAAVNADGSKVGVLPLGRHVRLQSMLYGLLLPSGNDAAVAIAERISGTVNRFVLAMNAEAARLGLGCTRYSSPSGYFDRGNYSCAADLAELAHADLQQSRIASVVHTYAAVLPFPIKGGKLYLYNNNPLLIYGYPGTTGLKTGYTEAAGRCLVATARRHGVQLGVVLLNSSAPANQARDLLNRGFEQVYHLPRVTEPSLPPDA